MFKPGIRSGHAAWIASLLLAACGGGSEPSSAISDVQEVQEGQAARPSKARLGETREAVVSGPRLAKRNYIVQLSEPPVAVYEGGNGEHAATRPTPGQKVDASQPTVARYKSHLAARQDAVLAGVGGGKALHHYGYVFNGFAAELTEAQAQKLAQSPGVLSVSKDERRKPATSSTPAFLGLSGHDGFWKETGAKGEDVVIGIIDTGIWPEHPSFSDRTRWGDRTYGRPRGWNGTCQTGVQFSASDCNRKLIGARHFNAGFGGDAGVAAEFPYEFLSPRDYDGHGTHTASTAGGNAGVQSTGPASVFGKISGIAPRARIAAYKACWGAGDDAGCTDSDTIAAIDQAVADGVDVINYSIGGVPDDLLWPVAIAFLRAADAGVFVAAAAGNAGPGAGTVEHSSPWVTTVAAGTHNRAAEGSVTLGNGVTYAGASVASALASSPMIDSAAAAAAGADPVKAALCYAAADNGGVAVLDPAKVAGKVVLCDRGVTARVAKSQAVLEAGGVGMVLVNTNVNSINADLHDVPTVHLPVADRAALKAYAALAGSSASIAQASIVYTTPAPFTASFSSRGPTPAATGDLLKPDIIAPGQDVLAGVAPPGYAGRSFDLLSGTSMSTPHIAGIAALMKELHPRWSPMAIKSALMTTLGDVRDGPNGDPSVIFSQGAGHVQPSSAADPGLVFDSGPKDWLGFLCGTQLPASVCRTAGVRVLDPSDLNVASIAIGDLAGTQTVTRRVTNVDGAHATYTPSYTGLPGFDVTISPSSLTLSPGQTKSFRVTFTRTTAALNVYAGGQLTWTGGTSRKKYDRHSVRVPMVVRPVALSAPSQVSGSYSVKFGYSGPFTAAARGLIPATTFDAAIANGGFVEIPVTVAPGTTYARFSLFDANVSQASDLDLYVFNAAGELVGSSGNVTADEVVSLLNPAAGTYTALVHGFSVPSGSADFKLFTWALGSAAAGNMAVSAPTTAVTAGTGTINLAFSGLLSGIRYLGSIVYGGDPAVPGPTIVRVDP